MITILQKDLADYFTSIRIIILFLLVLFASAAGLYAAFQGIRDTSLPEGFVFLGLFTTSGNVLPSLISLLALLVPIIGIALGFDAINSERSGGTLSRILSQPVYRDNLINGKFLAGIITLSLMVAATLLIVFGYGMRLIGVTPTAEEALRLFIYFIFSVIHGAFWMALAMLFSVVFRKVATSLLTSIGVWLFFSFFIVLIAQGIRNVELQQLIMRISPNTLFSEATAALLIPQPGSILGVMTLIQAGLSPSPLSLTQSLLLIWPQLIALIAISSIVFAISYVVFMRQEIRAT